MDSASIRKELLVQELSKVELELRHDSRLCSSFIYNQLGEDWNIDRVVQECATMHWLFSFTDYPHRCNEAYVYFSTIFNSGRQVSEFMKMNVQPYIKAHTIQLFGGIPEKWPWITPVNEQKVTSVSPRNSPINSPKNSPRNSPNNSPRNSPKNSPRNSPKNSPRNSPRNSPKLPDSNNFKKVESSSSENSNNGWLVVE